MFQQQSGSPGQGSTVLYSSSEAAFENWPTKQGAPAQLIRAMGGHVAGRHRCSWIADGDLLPLIAFDTHGHFIFGLEW